MSKCFDFLNSGPFDNIIGSARVLQRVRAERFWQRQNV